MLEHSDEIDRAVAGLRARRSPPRGAEARVFAGLGPMLAGPSGGGGLAAGVWVAKVIAATFVMTAGGLALVRGGAIVVGMAGEGGEPAPSEARTEDAASVGPSRQKEVREQTASVPEREPIERETSASEPALPRTSEPAIEPEPRPKSIVASPERGSPIALDDLESELAMIHDARAQTEPEQALTRLDAHAREFPNGSLADEREALRVVALCKLDRLAQARKAARALSVSRPSSPLIDRMRQGCPALADELGE